MDNNWGGDRKNIDYRTNKEKEDGEVNFLDSKFPYREIWADNFNDELMKELTDKLKTLSDDDKIQFGKSISFVSGGDFEIAFRSLIPKDPEEENIDEKIIKNIDEKNKINIEIPGNDVLISKFADELVKEIKHTDKIFFRQDLRKSVEVVENGFAIVEPNRFITLVEQYFNPYTQIFTKSGGKMSVQKSMNQQMSNIVLASSNFQDNIKNIKRLFPVPMPIIHNENLTFPISGYDHRFLSWLNKDSPIIKEDMPLNDAKKIFDNIYDEFCFQDKQDKTNAIAALITPFLRGLYSKFNVRSPLFCYMANRERAGKDYCAGITGLVLEGFNLEEPPISSGEYKSSGTNDELRKKLVSALISGKKRLHFANNKGRLNNAVLEGFLTSNTYSDRLLGKNESPTFDNEIDVSISGNMGMTFTADLSNRARFINLFLDIENANERNFNNPNLHKWVLEHRSEIISAIYSLIKNWFDNGKPKGSINFASFSEWAEICGGIMECAELGNPCAKDKISQSATLDPETAEMKELFELGFELKPNSWISKDDIKDIIISNDEPIFSYIDWTKKSDQTKFGKKLGLFVGRFLSDIKLMCDNNPRSVRRKYMFFKENRDNSSYNTLKSGHMATSGHLSAPNSYFSLGVIGGRGESVATCDHVTTSNFDDKLKKMIENPNKSYTPFELSIPVEELEILKKEGKIFEESKGNWKWLI